MREELIRLENVSFSYEKEKSQPDALHNINLSVKRGEYVSVIGHNGSGKSTLAKLLNLIVTPDEGKIIIDGKEITAQTLTEDDLFEVRGKIGMVFQNPDDQLVATVVEEDVAFGPENLGIEPTEIRRRVTDALATVGMTDYLKFAPHKLSGGQKQRVAIAGVLAMKPLCMIFDESTAMLDPRGRSEILDTMERLNEKEGITVIHITHHMNEAVRAHRTIVLDDGRIRLDGTPKEVFRNVAEIREMGLEIPQGANLLDRLRKSGCSLPSDCLLPDECAEALSVLLKGGDEA